MESRRNIATFEHDRRITLDEYDSLEESQADFVWRCHPFLRATSLRNEHAKPSPFAIAPDGLAATTANVHFQLTCDFLQNTDFLLPLRDLHCAQVLSAFETRRHSQI